MSLYQQFRPIRFSEIVGQDQVVAMLKQQTLSRQYHHAYLMFGASGTGKTSTARILAMALLCDTMNGTGEPCGECRQCRAIRQGQHWDVQELDGARFRGIDDVRDLAYRAALYPVSGKRKVYIIDECHQLTEAAWNGMLKMLEEPPSFLTIILCTTNYTKIPDTVVSRCELYPFHAIPTDLIAGKLSRICQGQGYTASQEGMRSLAMAAGGNMRKAENLLEQIMPVV